MVYCNTEDDQKLNNNDSEGRKEIIISLKFKSLFYTMYYNAHNGQKKTSLRVMNALSMLKAIQKSGLITLSNNESFCISCKRMKHDSLDLPNYVVKQSFNGNIPLPKFFIIFLRTTIPDKIFGTKWSDSLKLDRKRKVWYLFLRVL